ncbi:hypothetical protein HYPSUDRAFT_41541 [Hypholoma sublateritium FD-334 SS-4]|uniref:Transmembrane protein n=1 Tax=Hypholoma sublateritium (strain FD-334 SS-4) TaxID=945553 RepID=A0A0D2MEC4_HYPSF|nr:hypothetical protein HYPSUDRAFT_41541 [Hypholoma sublateritium FD-334 SS-4]
MLRKSKLFVIVAVSTLVAGMRLESRAAQTSAICSSDFAWTQNSKGASPCQVAASVDALCNNGNWVIGALNSSVMYANPSPVNGTASICTCSWASYNLLSACIACQGFPEQTAQWTVYSFGCAGLESTTFFPANVTLPSSVAIPAWAQKNPTQWTDETFNTAEAKNISAEGIPDFVSGAPSTTHKKSNVGPIVGGVLGGLIVLVGAAIVAFWMIRRHRKVNHGVSAPMHIRPEHHARNMSEMSAASMLKLPEVGGYTQMPPTPASPTMTSSMLSLNYFTRRSVASPPPVSIRQTTPGPREDVIEPYSLPPTVDNFDRDRKRAHGPQPIYGNPSDPPPMRVDSTRPQTPTRGRFNPPPYVPSSPGSSSTGQRPRHLEKQPSTDTQHSLTSSRNGGTHTHSPNASGSGMPSMITQVERANATSPAHGRTLSGESRDEKGVHSVSPSDIA